uniref:Uncharacterized protein n=1 Tax=Fagus sylvatica TaxID=28930 RepID=A0A2N9FD19_FAGSY
MTRITIPPSSMSLLCFTLARPIWSRLIDGGSDGMSGFCRCGWVVLADVGHVLVID